LRRAPGKQRPDSSKRMAPPHRSAGHRALSPRTRSTSQTRHAPASPHPPRVGAASAAMLFQSFRRPAKSITAEATPIGGLDARHRIALAQSGRIFGCWTGSKPSAELRFLAPYVGTPTHGLGPALTPLHRSSRLVRKERRNST
jgi:hypothetical protein